MNDRAYTFDEMLWIACINDTGSRQCFKRGDYRRPGLTLKLACAIRSGGEKLEPPLFRFSV